MGTLNLGFNRLNRRFSLGFMKKFAKRTSNRPFAGDLATRGQVPGRNKKTSSFEMTFFYF